ncbi:Afadin and alpha-actinin-binding-domain-containing protein [Dichomitus squalens]|uniref:Afadin and alpha-actinin-binding-domain-containing protein n=1 Tax=Dichomitus squalens TaxID=114155 RepID=A0A4Q9MDB8_9APHY|nr:Afadin and alpha-actinin-binding-domain-containing protein [Dichomitus squalens]
MNARTPKKLVHWALDASLSELASPAFSDAGSSESCTSTSSLQYVNSQLIAHGFVHDTGLSLDGLAKADADRVVKCILGMLSQRIDDMTRTEDLTTKLRTLSYDHERLTSMYKTEKETAANAEREMNLHKSRASAASKSLQSSDNAHKHTTAELQRTRASLHALRVAYQTEIKKLEKEKERMLERWTKLSDSQLKAGTLPAGLTLTSANQSVVDANEVQLRGKGQGFLDVALEQAENARKELVEQNRRLRGVLLNAANELHNLLHAARTAGEADAPSEPEPLSSSALFQSQPAESAGEALSSLFQSLRETISRKAASSTTPCNCSRKDSSPPSTQTRTTPTRPQDSAEIERLQAVIDKLRDDLDESQKQAAASAAQTQELFDRYAEDQRLAASNVGEMSVDLITAPVRDEEKQRLDTRFRELEEERRKFTEAAVRLGKEKAALEAERLKLLEEKRSWEVEMMLAELPPTPAPVAGPSNPSIPAVPPSLVARRSPRKSPRKLKGKTASPRKTRVSRRSSGLGVLLSPKAKAPPKGKVVPAYETEVIPSTIPPSPVKPPPEFKTSMAVPAPPSPALLTSTFVLPPPSPAASFPSREGGGTPLPPIPPLPKLEIPPLPEDTSEDDLMDTTHEPASSASSSSLPSASAASSTSSLAPAPVPSTPGARSFPMAKPLAQRMIHAYSPVKPSPLSRILMLARSPDSPPVAALDALAEVDENAMDLDVSHIPAHAMQPSRTLAEELGVSEDDDNPLREKPAPADKPKVVEKGKGKARADAAPQVQAQTRTSRARAGGALEKENVKRAKLNPPTAAATASGKGAAASKDVKKPPSKPANGVSTRARTAAAGGRGTVVKPPSKGGPRRVPIGSAEAAPVPSWRR